MANGQVTTGFSQPWVAKYSESQGSVTYSDAQVLARGVEVSVDIDTSDDNKFYADNIEAENDSGAFVSGTLNLTVDGLLLAAEKLIMGLQTADADGFVNYDDNQNIPYVGVGFIRRVMSGGTTSYIPYIYPKVKFNQITVNAATQEAEIDWQTQELTAAINRDDTTSRKWQRVGTAQSSESAAEAIVQAALGVTVTTT